jgi:hypothetical protein
MINACKATPLDARCHCVHHGCILLCLHELCIPVVVVDDDDDDDDEACSDKIIYFVTLIFSKSAGKIHYYPITRNINALSK